MIYGVLIRQFQLKGSNNKISHKINLNNYKEMRIKQKLLNEECPTQNYKMQIRRRHRQQIMNGMRAKYIQANGLQSSINNISEMINCHMSGLAQLDRMRENKDEVDEGTRRIGQPIRYDNQQQRRYYDGDNVNTFAKSMDPKHRRGSWQDKKSIYKLDLLFVKQILQKINYYLSELQMDWLSQCLEKQLQSQDTQHITTNPPKKLYTKLCGLISTQLPHIAYTLYQMELHDRQQYNSNKYSNSTDTDVDGYNQVTFGNRMAYDENVLNSIINVDRCNPNTVRKICIQILCALTAVPLLATSYVYQQEDACGNGRRNRYQQYQPCLLIAEELICFLQPTDIFYSSVIAIGNLLTHQSSYYSQLYYNILQNVSIESILSQKLMLYNMEYQKQSQYLQCQYEQQSDDSNTTTHRHRHRASYVATPTQNCNNDQQLVLWLIHKYMQYLASIQRTIENKFLTRQLQSYIVNLFNSIHAHNHKYEPMLHLNQHQAQMIRYLVSVIERAEFKFDNVFIVNTVIPVLRANWANKDIANLWLYLTFTDDYNLPELIHLELQQDKETVKNYHKYHQNQHQNQSEQQDEEGDGPEETVTQYHCNKNDSKVMAIVKFIQEMLYTITDGEPHGIFAKRDKNLLQGVYNILLDMEPFRAKEVWDCLFTYNERTQAKLNQFQYLGKLLDEIQDFINKAQQ